MKWWLLLIPLCFRSIPAKSQSANPSLAESVAGKTPRSETSSPTSIAAFLNKNLTEPEDKVRAAYYWVTHNIRYDRDSMYAINAGPDPQAKIREALRRKKGVCENFAAIFSELCRQCGVSSYVVDGYTSAGTGVNKSGHSWSAVLLNNKWFMCDPTWDEAYSGEPHYFTISPAIFIEDHLPFDPIWQLTPELVTPAEFYGRSRHTTAAGYPNPYLDSLAAFLTRDELEQYRETARRMRSAGIESELAKVRLAFINMKIGISYEDHDIDLYNAAISDYNKGLKLLNAYINYRNAKFLPAKPDAEIAGMIAPISDILLSAMQKLDILLNTPEQYQTDASVLNNKLSALTAKLHDQERFLKLYLAEKPGVREKLFYTVLN